MKYVTDVYLKHDDGCAKVVYKVVTVGAKRDHYSSEQVAAQLHWATYQKIDPNSPRLDEIANRSMLTGRMLTEDEAMEILKPDLFAYSLSR
jgi:hypothetical protein